MDYSSLKDIPPLTFSVWFPNLKDNYHKTSKATDDYNCAAHVVSITDDKVDSYFGHWPDDLEKGLMIEHYEKFYELYDFKKCSNPQLEEGIEKIALFGIDGEFLHIALQLSNGNWTSKMGDYEDIEHYTLDCVGGGDYGKAESFMKRKREKEFIFPS